MHSLYTSLTKHDVMHGTEILCSIKIIIKQISEMILSCKQWKVDFVC